MSEEFNYLEETRRLSSEPKNSAAWACCIVSGTRPSYEDVKKAAEQTGNKLTRSQYEKACRQLGFKL